jgi:hypothetical protein
VKSRFHKSFSRFYFAGETFADAPLGSQRDRGGFWMLSVSVFYRRLQ